MPLIVFILILSPGQVSAVYSDLYLECIQLNTGQAVQLITPEAKSNIITVHNYILLNIHFYFPC